MKTTDEIPLRGHSREAIEEASAWLALLHGPRRDENIVQGLRSWLAESPRHKSAFEAVTAMWELTEKLPKPPLPRQVQRTGFKRVAIAMAAGVVLAVGAGFLYRGYAGVATGVGEQRTLTLEDGTRVYLNTGTRVKVRFSSERRGVELIAGEALFEVAKQGPERPFVVSAGDRRITALGTAFVVRRDSQIVAVTLMEGKVAVTGTEESKILNPGQRLTFAGVGKPRLDLPEVEKVTAWRRGRVELNDMPLADAVAEMNRYTTVKLTIERPEASALTVKGAFRAGDTLSFAQSVASACALEIVQKTNEIVLAGTLSGNCR